jgi:peptide-methionine (R)-S-oxide reductase
MMTRRTVGLGAVGAVAAGLGARLFGSTSEAKDHHVYPVSHSEAEWKQQLTPEQYRVLRQHGTERAGTSPLNAEKRKGVFACAGCDQPLFESDTKYESGTGWPSFYKPIDGAIGTSQDNTLFMTRTEVHCSRCGGHLGHVFEDGPKPTGLRYCMNGVAMTLKPADAA